MGLAFPVELEIGILLLIWFLVKFMMNWGSLSREGGDAVLLFFRVLYVLSTRCSRS